jgi:hypothetical protein
MEFTEQFITDNGLTAEQVTAVTGQFTTEFIPNLRKEYDTEYSGKANENAEGILKGASEHAKKTLGFELERNQGEKYGDYLSRGFDFKFSSMQEGLTSKQKELNEKLANFKGGDEYKLQLDGMKLDNDSLLQRIAKLEPLEGLDEKYQGATVELSKLKREVGYNSVKPSFPKEVNTFEADSKWNSFISNIEKNYNIELVDGKPIAIDKENKHKTFDLQELVDSDTSIKELLKGRQQGGNGASSIDFEKVEGIPFDVPKGLTTENQSKLVSEHLEKTLGSKFHKDYLSMFKELLGKVKAVK